MPPPTPPIVNDGRMIAGKADRLDARERVLQRVHDGGGRHRDADLLHRLAELEAILGDLDGVDLRADQLDAVLVEDAGLGQIDGEVQRGLPADGGQQRVGTFARR